MKIPAVEFEKGFFGGMFTGHDMKKIE